MDGLLCSSVFTGHWPLATDHLFLSLDRLPLTTDPVWPWSLPAFGWPALALTALLLLGATAWSYFRVPGAHPGRVTIVLVIRVLALLLVFLALAGASCVRRDEMRVPSLVLVGIDVTQSMKVADESGRVARWEELLNVLRDCKPVLDKLRDEHNVKVLFFRFGDEVAEFDPDNPGDADGKRTDTAQLLSTLYEKYRGERYLRACLILSDGANNVASEPSAEKLAAQYRNLPCPIYTFAFGNKATTSQDRDIVVTSITTDPSVVAVKGKMTVRATVDALGFVGRAVRVRVFLNDKEVAGETETLRLRKDNQVQVVVDAPAEPGEYKVTLKVHDPDTLKELPGELSAANNQMDTFATVTREGLSVLLVERQERFPEPQMMLSALAADKRMRVDVAWLRGPSKLDENQKGLFQFDEQPYDVIILGDVTAARLREADPQALEKIHDRVVNKRTGLLMLGGPHSFGNGDWAGTELAKLLPVELNVKGRNDSDVKLWATAEGLKYVLRLADNPEDSKDLWEKVQKEALLNGVTRLGKPLGNARVFAETSAGGEPVLVGSDFGTGRTMAFGADTTYLWVRPKTGGRAAHARFWRQVVLWLARQEDTDDNLRLRPDTRRLPLGSQLNFGVELRGKQGEEIKDPRYGVKVVDPKGGETAVEVVRGLPGSRSASESRGTFKPRLAGEYRIQATGSGKDHAGKAVDGRTEARFIVYQDDVETSEKAANPDFLKDLAAAGGGQDYRPRELRRFLEQLPAKPLPNPPPKPSKFPDWRTTRGRSPFLLAFLLLFVQLLALEWFLRRRWGMV